MLKISYRIIEIHHIYTNYTIIIISKKNHLHFTMTKPLFSHFRCKIR